MLKFLFGKTQSAPAADLPQPNSAVDVSVAGRTPRSVMLESCSRRGIITREVLGRPGEIATMHYQTSTGRFRLLTKVVAIRAGSTHFDVPKRVESVTGDAQKRSSVRLDTLVPGSWRFAPGGKGTGEFLRATLRDISRGGCALNIDRALRIGATVEVRLALAEGKAPLVLLGEVMRHDEIKTSGKHSHGLRFHGVRPEQEHAIIDFINRKQADLRSRGLA